ncbi:MAG: YqiA/YcfP family alpha/beta fold hydrolase [Paracoccaceae bacterium]|nr:YqiA/YcfP family alpha/beta fold hydrolase [Paracoccaceae bacterium]
MTSKILYIHGFASFYDPTKSKCQILQSLGEVVGVDIDYCEGFGTAFTKASAAARTCDLVIGTSMGGFMASHVGAALGIPFVALNPAIAPQETLLRHLGTFTDYCGDEKVLDAAIVADYPGFQTVGGCGLILLETGDDVIDPNRTFAELNSIYSVKMVDGGSHRFSSLSEQMEEIAAFQRRAEVVYGFGSD